MSFVDVREKPLPREQGPRAKRPSSFWTDGATAREPNRSPWTKRFPVPRYVVPRFDPLAQPQGDPDKMPEYIRRQLQREREGRQWVGRGARVARELSRYNALSRALDLAEAIDGWRKPNRTKEPGNKIGIRIPFMRKVDGYYGHPNPGAAGAGTEYLWYAPGSLHVNTNQFQLTGQGYGSGYWIGDFAPLDLKAGQTVTADYTGVPLGNIPNQLMFGHDTGVRWAEHSSWVKDHQFVFPVPLSIEVVPWVHIASPGLDANVTRFLPGEAPAPDYVTVPSRVIDPFRAPSWVDDAVAQLPENLKGYAATVEPFAAFSVSTDSHAVGRVPVSPRADPGPSVRERKTLSRVAKFGIAVYKALDASSEAADVVDAVYEALPEDVKKRWGRDRRGAVDQFGQYGFNGMDWKLQAIWHNYHRLDVNQAMQNILKNELEDRVYGAIHKRLPPQAGGPALDPAWKKFGELMKSIGF